MWAGETGRSAWDTSVTRAGQGDGAQIGVAVIRKSLDATQVQGDAMVELIQAASDIAKELGKGVQFDAHA